MVSLSDIFSFVNKENSVKILLLLFVIFGATVFLDNVFFGFIRSYKIERQIIAFSQLIKIQHDYKNIDKNPEAHLVFSSLLNQICLDNKACSTAQTNMINTCSITSIKPIQQQNNNNHKLLTVFGFWAWITLVLVFDKKGDNLQSIIICLGLGLILGLLALSLPTFINPIADGFIFYDVLPIAILLAIHVFSKKSTQPT